LYNLNLKSYKKPMDQSGFSYGSGSRQRSSNARQPSNPRDARASAAVSDWAEKKR